jgi:hypothetical protein
MLKTGSITLKVFQKKAEIKSTFERSRLADRHDAESHPLCPNMAWEEFRIEYHARNVNP